MGAWCDSNQGSFGDVIEIRSKVTRAFECQYFLFVWLNTNMTKDVLVVSLHTLARDKDRNRTNSENRTGSQIDLATWNAAASSDELSGT